MVDKDTHQENSRRRRDVLDESSEEGLRVQRLVQVLGLSLGDLQKGRILIT